MTEFNLEEIQAEKQSLRYSQGTSNMLSMMKKLQDQQFSYRNSLTVFGDNSTKSGTALMIHRRPKICLKDVDLRDLLIYSNNKIWHRLSYSHQTRKTSLLSSAWTMLKETHHLKKISCKKEWVPAHDQLPKTSLT